MLRRWHRRTRWRRTIGHSDIWTFGRGQAFETRPSGERSECGRGELFPERREKDGSNVAMSRYPNIQISQYLMPHWSGGAGSRGVGMSGH